jgi:hypothetical protein
MSMVRVQFLRKQTPYNAGEIAGFDDSVAQRLIKAGVAKLAPANGETREEAGADAEHWKQKFYELAAEHEKTKSAAQQIGSLQEQRDSLADRVVGLEEEVKRARQRSADLEARTSAAGPVDAEGQPIDVASKDAAASEPAASEEGASGTEDPNPPVKSPAENREKDLKGPRVDKMIRGATVEKKTEK